MLSALAEVYPRALSKAALGQAANISSTSGTFDTYLSRLRRLELVSIEWTDTTWNPVRGCAASRRAASNCYADEGMAARFSDPGAIRATYQRDGDPGRRAPLDRQGRAQSRDALAEPLSWRKPRPRVRQQMGDLFHEDVPDEWIDKCFAVMALAPQHTFQVLTKRADRMREYLRAEESMPLERLALFRIGNRVEAMRTDDQAVGPLPHLDGGTPWWPLAECLAGRLLRGPGAR
jgi:protein gp37